MEPKFTSCMTGCKGMRFDHFPCRTLLFSLVHTGMQQRAVSGSERARNTLVSHCYYKYIFPCRTLLFSLVHTDCVQQRGESDQLVLSLEQEVRRGSPRPHHAAQNMGGHCITRWTFSLSHSNTVRCQCRAAHNPQNRCSADGENTLRYRVSFT